MVGQFLNSKENKFFPNVKAFVSVNGIETGVREPVPNSFFVKELKLEESFCKLYDMEVVIDSCFLNYSDDVFSFDSSNYSKFLNQSAVVTIIIDPTPLKFEAKLHQRIISGLITDFEYVYTYDEAERIDYSLIKLKIKPLISALDFEPNNKIFTNTTIADIFAELFKNKKETTIQYKYTNQALKQTKMAFKIQYQETDFAFFIRLCQENKLYFYFYYDDKGKEFLTIADTATPAQFISLQDNPLEIVYNERDFTLSKRFQCIMYPEYKCGLQTRQHEPHLEWPLQWPKKNMVLEASFLCCMVFPGNLMSLKNPDSASAPPEDKIVVSSTTTIRVDDASKLTQKISHDVVFYSFSFGVCLLRQIQKPKILGIQYAMVVGQSANAETSSINDTTPKGGTVSVNLYLEQWPAGSRVYSLPPVPAPPVPINIPVAQPFGGQSGQNGYCGVWWMPRVGQAVVVDFYNGDPDQPVITGTVYNSHNVNNSWVPGGKNVIPTYSTYDASANAVATQMTPAQFAMVSCTTPGGKTGSVILLDDKSDETAPQMYLATNGNSSFASLNNSTVAVLKGNYVTQVGTGKGMSTMTFDNKGNLTIHVPGNMNFKADKDMSFTCENLNMTTSKNVTLTASENVTTTATKNVNMNSTQSTQIHSGTAMAIEGGTSLELTSKTVSVSGVNTEVTGKNLSLQGTMSVAVQGAMVQLN